MNTNQTMEERIEKTKKTKKKTNNENKNHFSFSLLNYE